MWIPLDMSVGWGVDWVCVSAACRYIIWYLLDCMCEILVFANNEGKWYLLGVSAECAVLAGMQVCPVCCVCGSLPIGCMVMLPPRSLCVKCPMISPTKDPMLGQRLLSLGLGWLGRHERSLGSPLLQEVRKQRDSRNYCEQGHGDPARDRCWLPLVCRGQCLDASSPVRYKW